MAQPLTPRFVLVGSAGVTRPDRPGIDVDLEPPAVRMNDMLGGILTYKLAGGDSTRPALPCRGLASCCMTWRVLSHGSISVRVLQCAAYPTPTHTCLPDPACLPAFS